MGVTQADVARRSGVSPKTVSNVIAGYEHVSSDVRRRVLLAVEELGYRPHRAAQAMRTGKTGVIGLAVPELDVPYFGELARHVLAAAEARGYQVLIVQTLADADRERAYLNDLGPKMTDGLLFSPVATGASDIRARQSSSPLVLIGEQVHEGRVDHVGIDDVAAARMATEHLIAQGCRRIGFLGHSRRGDLNMARLRRKGYLQALNAANLTAKPGLSPAVEGYHYRDGALAIREVLGTVRLSDIDGVFCANDLLAIGAMRELHRAGVHIPHDIAIVGFDGSDIAEFTTPALTTIAPDKQQLAVTAVELLLSRINDSAAPAADNTTSFSLQIRESSTLAPIQESHVQTSA